MAEAKSPGLFRLKRVIHRIVIIVLLIVGILFTLLNPGIVNVDFVAKTVALPLSILMFICFAVGMIIGLLIGYARSWKRVFGKK